MVSDTSGILTRNELQEELNKVKEQIQVLQKSDKANKEKSAELEKQIQSIDVLSKTYPVGSIYISTSSVNPAPIFGGTWESFGTGRTIVGVDTSNTNFNAVSKTGGLENSSLTIANLPSHNHTIPALKGSSNSAGNHTHTRGTMEITGSIEPIGGGEPKLGFPTGAFYAYDRVTYYSSAPVVQSEFGRFDGFKFAASKSWTGETSLNGDHTHTITTEENKTGFEGSGNTFTNLQPYITVYMWKRVS